MAKIKSNRDEFSTTPTAPDRTYYWKLQRRARTFRVDLPKKKWCDLWHQHFDWNGTGNLTKLDRRRHLNALFQAFHRAERELAAQIMPYQIFLIISLADSAADAVYIHTPNPNSTNFPTDFGHYTFLNQVPPLLAGLVKLDGYRIGSFTEGKEVWYTIVPKQHLPS